jgi:TrmH family RNA methyltransferase
MNSSSGALHSSLDNLSIVLVDVKTPANIGSVARGMMNMGVSRLVLVNPPKDERGDARKLAAGAEELIERAQRFTSLEAAVADQGLVFGASRHAGKRRKNVWTPRDLSLMALPLLGENKVSLVFGNEVNGLENSHLALCHGTVAIPSAERFPSLNLSHAVMVVLYEFFIASLSSLPLAEIELATGGEIEHFYTHLQQTLEDIGFLDRTQTERMMFSLRQVFGRARLDPREVRTLEGILSAMERYIKVSGKNRE